ncbi:putative sperm flagellar membrane protein domain-containing protein [Phthorimaea operculella]|nr:putative sperm flagellar membrane protein domain-containing protein [Phthorimaea operculella]
MAKDFQKRWFACFALLCISLVSCQDINNEETLEEVTRIKRDSVPENRDLTVLLVNDKRNEYNTKIGRYHSVKPLIGLLTSTARTFIQDGVTTEFATQILGTTLDNGRIYAQLLTKSSLVLYNKPSNVDDAIKPTRIHSKFDGEWNVKQDLGFIDPEKFVLKNTDYISPSKMEIVYASKPAQDNVKIWSPTSPDNLENQIIEEPTGRRVQQYNEVPRYQNNEAYNLLDGPPADKMNTKITFLAADIPVATATYKPHEENTATRLTTPSTDDNRSEKALYNDEESLKKVLYEVDKMPDSISVQYNNGFDLNLDVLQPSEPAVTTTESTRFTDNLDVIPIKDSNSQATEPLSTLRPSATIIEEYKESVVTESGDMADIFTNSEEESENTAAEVTDSDDIAQEITTEMSFDKITTTESGHSEESYEDIETTTETKQDSAQEDVACTNGLEIQSTMTTAYKTLTYLTTYFIPLESTETTTSVKSDVVVESNVGYLTNVVCKSNAIEPTAVLSVDVKSSVQSNSGQPDSSPEEVVAKPAQVESSTENAPTTTTSQTTTSDEKQASEKQSEQENEQSTTTTSTTTTERVDVSVSTEESTTPAQRTTPQDTDTSSEENEIDLIYKTLYTTYTYFTTFFGDQTSSVASHKSVVTNIITSTIDLSKLDPSLLGAFDDDEIAPTSVGIGRPTETFAINSAIDLVKNKDVIESVESDSVYSSQTPTPSLGDDVASIKPDAVKTYYTTYTFFTTIYVGSDANVCSRSEVYTNYVGPDELIPTKTNPLAAESTKAQFDFRNCKQIKNALPSNPEENSSVETSVSMEEKDKSSEQEQQEVTPQPSPSTPLEVDMLFSVESNPVESENSYAIDVKSSSSSGERSYLENNNILDDQISSESNIEEIMPSPTLLLQTSYTTFTYFTTMYIGKDSSKVKSRLETITNVVTETIMPKKELEEESNLPITYYTTFTYWTTLSKNKSTTITSHEEIVSNVVTPTVQAVTTASPIDTTPIDIDSVLPPKDLEVELKPSLLDDSLEHADGKATFYTTYTYFTTFYAGNTSQIRSSLETVTNIVDNTKVVEDNQLGRKVAGPVDKNLIQDNGEKPILITPTVVKEEIQATKLPDASSASPTVLLGFGGVRKQSAFPGSSSSGKRFSGRSSASANVPAASRSGGFNRASITPTSRRTGFRSSSIRANSLDFASRSALPRIRPTASSRLRGGRQSASISLPPPDQNESETSVTQQEENSTEQLEEVTDVPVRTTNNPLSRFRRPPISRQPGTALTPRSTTPVPRRTEPETEPPSYVTPKHRTSNRYSARLSNNARTTTVASPRSSGRQPFIIRGGESRPTTTSASAYRRNGKSRPSSRTTTISSRPKPPRLQSDRSRSGSSTRSSGRSRSRTTTGRTSSRQRNSYENFSGERYNNYNNIVNDGKFTVTHQIPTEVTIPIVNGKITEYKSVLSATPRLETLLPNQISTSIGPLGNPVLVLVSEATEIADNGATKLVKFVLHDTPTTTVIFTPTTIRGRKTSFSHVLPSTVYNVEPVTQTIAPEISANVPLANLLLSQLLLGNQQPQINPLLAYQQQDLTSNEDDFVDDFQEDKEDSPPPPPPPPKRRNNKPKPPKPAPAKQTSVVTLYVSGRHPGEFSTVLSTVVSDDTQSVRKREAIYFDDIKIEPSVLPNINELASSQDDNTDSGITSIDRFDETLESDFGTQSLESIVGELTEDDLNWTGPWLLHPRPSLEEPTPHPALPNLGAFNTNGIVYDNTPWRPGREMELVDKPVSEEDERKLKNLATRIMSNGVEVLVKDKSADSKQEQRKLKFMHVTSLKPHHHISTPPPKQSLLSSAVATFINQQHMSAMYPLHQLMQHNYIIKTCMTTYTYLTTVVHNKRSAISTFETIVSVVTTESLTHLYPTAVMPDIKPTKTKYMEVKTIQPTVPSNVFVSNFPKIDKRIDNPDDSDNFELIQPSEHGHVPCTSSCSCSHTRTEGLKTKYTNLHDHSMSASKYGMKTSKYGASKVDLRPTKIDQSDKKTNYGPYEYEAQLAPTDRIVEKYTEVINDYSDEKESNSVEESELLTNEQAPSPPKVNKVSNNKNQEKPKPEKPQKPNKNKVLVADLLKLGSLGIKGLSQLAPVIEKMTGGFIKRHEQNKTTTTSTTVKPAEKLTPYQVNKRLDSDLEYSNKHTNFPIYIPVDELETSESQLVFTNATLHQNLAWAAEHKQPKAHIVPPKIIHESPLVNGGIPISPGEIITANSDVIVGKPAVGGPLTLAASGIKLHNSVNPPPIDSFVSANEHYEVQEKPTKPEYNLHGANIDDSFDLRPPEPPKPQNRPMNRPSFSHPVPPPPTNIHQRFPMSHSSDQMMKTEHIKTSAMLGNHGRPAFLDYIPSLAKQSSPAPKPQGDYKPVVEDNEDDIPDNSPSSSEVVHSKVTPDGEVISKPFLVDIQPSRVANVLIPHGSATALVFAGSSEPHKTGDYVDDPLPYPEPGYFGSFSIDAPQMTNVHNVPPKKQLFTSKPSHHHSPPESYKPDLQPPYKDQPFRNELKYKWKESKRPVDYNKLPPPTSNQETHVQIGPQITVYNPDIFKHSNGDFEKYKNTRGNKYKDGKEVIDKEYENYLAVPPPPPPKMHFNTDQNQGHNKPYNQRPVVHTKPIQDMKVFLNIRHPVPKQPTSDSLPPKVTSEIYYAAQAPNTKPAPTYTIHMPPSPPSYGNTYNKGPATPPYHVPSSDNVGQISNTFSVVSSPNFANKSIFTNDINVSDKDNTYTVTLNTATNVANNVGETSQVVGTSVPVAVGTSTHVEHGQLNADIPIGTNFAIRVEDGSQSQPNENYHTQNNRNEHGRIPEVTVGDNRWNLSISERKPIPETTVIGHHYYNQNFDEKTNHDNTASSSIIPSVNSHANFPMMNEQHTTSTPFDNVKPVTENVDEKPTDQRRPAKLIPNIPTNSHGWYSSILNNENALNHVNKIVVEQPTTRKIIPLSHDNQDTVPDFGQKITSVGKPPSEYWAQQYGTPSDQGNYNIGQPFTRPQVTTVRPTSNAPLFSVRPYNPGYIPSYFGGMKQPAYDIPMMVNSTNVASYEDGMELNIGEEIGTSTTSKPVTHIPYRNTNTDKYKRPPPRPVYYAHDNSSNIITSTVTIKDKKPLVVEKVPEKSTESSIFLTTSDINRSSSEILDLSPPPPTLEYSFKPSPNDEMIMGMSPPPPATAPPRVPQRTHPTPNPYLNRNPQNHRTKPPKTLPPRVTTQRPIRRPINREEISTYKPTYDILNNIKRPVYNREQPSSQLLPPPRNILTRITPINDLPSPTIDIHPVPNVVFPTPISSGWLTSSGVDFSSSFDFRPTSVQFPEISQSSHVLETEQSSTENSYSYEVPSSSERNEEASSEKHTTEDRLSSSKESSTEAIQSSTRKPSSSEENVSDSVGSETSQEDTTTDKMKVLPIRNKNRTRKPYPLKHDDKKSTTSKYKLPSKPTSIIRPTRTLNRPDLLFPTRHTSTRKIIRPIPTRSSTTISPSLIESSESSIDDEFVKPTEVLKDSITPTVTQPEKTILKEEERPSYVTLSRDDSSTAVQPTYHTGNEVKISDEIVPTKTEFRTTVVTLTKTLSEPPRTVSSIGYLNVTHTLTVTHTKTSLISQSEGAVTQTLILTNTHTSTVVDVVTEVHTQVQPTTIVETVTKHIPIPKVDPTPVQNIPAKTKAPLDDLTMSSEEENLIIKDNEKGTTENVQKIETESEGDNDTFFVVMNKSQNGGKTPPIATDIETGEYDITRNEQVNSNGVSQVLFGEILLAGTPYLETTNVVAPGIAFMKECQPDCKASRNERCQRIDGMMKCVCRPGFARMFPDRPCKPTYTYSVKLALGSQGNERLKFNDKLYDNTSKEYHSLAAATYEGINRMVMQSDLRDVYHGVHITGFQPVEVKSEGEDYQGVMNDFYVQLSDNAHESRLKEVIEKYLRNNNYSLGGTDVHAAEELVDRLDVSDFDECTSGLFHDCSEHAQCFNLRGTYTCSCLEGYADLSVNNLYPGRICSAEPVGCELCNYHGSCYSRDDQRVLCECFQWYAGSTCHINLKVVLISLVVLGALLTIVLTVCAIVACRRPRPPPRSIVTCIQGMPFSQQGAMPKQRADRRALISDRTDSGDASSVQNASLPYMPAKRVSTSKKCMISEPPSHDPPPVPAPAVMIPRARLHPHHSDSRENISRKKSMELSSEAKLISYLESGAVTTNDEMRRKHSMESSYSANKDRHNHNKQGALVSAGFKVSTTIRPDEGPMNNDRDDVSSINKNDLEAELHFDSLRKSYSQEDLSEWTDAERRIGELTLSEARSVGGTLPASTGRAASSTRLTHQEANTMAERDLGSTFLLPHVHLYKPDLTSDVSEFDSL